MSWANEIEIPKQVNDVIGNSEVRTDQDILNKNVSARVSENHKRMLKAVMDKLNEGQVKKLNEGDIIRQCIELAHRTHCKTK